MSFLNFHSYNNLAVTKTKKVVNIIKNCRLLLKGKKFSKIITSKSKTIKIRPIKKNCKENGIRVIILFSIPHSKDEFEFLFSIRNSLNKKFKIINIKPTHNINLKIRIIIKI
jgi:hypothetical protein